MIADSAVYAGGYRTTLRSLGEAYRSCQEPDRFAWVTLFEPTKEEFISADREFQLHGMAVDDAIQTHQRPKLERYGHCLFAVLKLARYLDDKKRIEFGEVHAFVGENFIITVSYGEDSTLEEVRRRMEGEPDQLRRGPTAVFYEVMSQIVEGYNPVVEGLENDIDEIEAEVFAGNVEASRRIHEISHEVIRLHQATKPLVGALERITESDAVSDPEKRKRLRRVQDRVLRVTEQIEGFRDLLSSIMDVNLTTIGVQQNDQMQKISAWGAVLIVPTLIAGIFGMNFENEQWQQFKSLDHGFELSVAAMVLISFLLYLWFKRSGWL
ncbi:MAG: magnesium and cobalt transport protein CorA [Rubrobacteraceae bacterium]|nr:magnesium and cobalt transport protein CorA [Rubrobacteraceae bacterium]